MQEMTLEKARELGRLVGQSDEYKALARARDRMNDDRDVSTLLSRLGELEQSLTGAMQKGETPEESEQSEYESLFTALQSNSTYQSFVAAQANFEKILSRVNEEISQGMESGAKSGIILPT